MIDGQPHVSGFEIITGEYYGNLLTNNILNRVACETFLGLILPPNYYKYGQGGAMNRLEAAAKASKSLILFFA